jgi:hypothetical protein
VRALAALAILVLLGAALATAVARRQDRRSAPSGSTLRGTWIDADGDGILERGPGEALADRTELAPAARPVKRLALFAQLTDAHVRDEESPARAAILDRLGPPFTSTFRPQEALTAQVLSAAVASIDRVHPQAVLETGDLVDSAQANELDMALAVLRGGRVDPNSGAPGYDGPQSASNPDPFFYRPDVDAPRHPGLLTRAQLPFDSPGLRAPWYPVLGNHDLLLDGEVPATEPLERLAVGSRFPVRLDPGVRVPHGRRASAPALVERVLGRGLVQTRPVPADPRRRYLHPGEAMRRLRSASGHGGRGPRLDYAFDVGPRLRVIVLDLIARGGGSGGRVVPSQVGWLGRELRRAGRRYVIVASHQPLRSSAGGGRALALLDRSPRVVAAVAGDTHHNRIRPRRVRGRGYWLIETASLADYPEQARAFRLVETAGGGVALETWMLDTAPDALASTSRELAYLDAQGGRPAAFAGRRSDRNARLYR